MLLVHRRRRSGLFASALLACCACAGACNTSFDPDWHEPGNSQVTPEVDAAPMMPNPMPEPSEAGQEAGQGAEVDASALSDASIVSQPPPLVCRVDSCPDGGDPSCKAVCTAVPCDAGTELCRVDCALCGVPLK